MKMWLKRQFPKSVWSAMRAGRHGATKAMRRGVESLGYCVAKKSDFYSPLPSEFELRQSAHRWNKPSALRGVRYDLDAIRLRLSGLMSRYYDEFGRLTPYKQLQEIGFGPGYPQVDALVLYAMIRDLKPRRYLEVGSGLSTYYCSLAARKNSEEGHQTRITCIEPFPFEALSKIEGIEKIKSFVQDVPVEKFTELEAGDVLFIDSSHSVRIDGDVPFLFLEVLPAIKKGVHVHIHDIPFPFNTPYPADYWVLTRDRTSPHWPVYWTEAMLVQAFLSFNPCFEIALSCPMLRHFDEPFLRRTVPLYKNVAEEPNTFSALWLVRSKRPCADMVWCS